MRFGYLLHDNRSGSTYLSAVLNQYSRMAVSVESYYTTRILDWDRPLDRPFDIDRLVDFLFEEVQFQETGIDRTELLAALKALPRPTKQKIIPEIVKLHFGTIDPNLFYLVKDPVYRYMKTLHSWYPSIMFIHIYRDGRGVHKSRKGTINLKGRRMTGSVIKSAIKWRQRFGELRRSGVPDECIIHVQYESLLMDRRSTSEMILRRLGMD